jgi:hypothetical protein
MKKILILSKDEVKVLSKTLTEKVSRFIGETDVMEDYIENLGVEDRRTAFEMRGLIDSRIRRISLMKKILERLN